MYGRALVLSIGCWLDGGRTESELEVDLKERVGLWLEKPGVWNI